mmetsp:Transcript_96615/g.166511  ORF Transcript_96615/g.166511 Transcript_96615/m.166511 type:complete len:83 (-) Transcript_96615:1190-1438(-)
MFPSLGLCTMLCTGSSPTRQRHNKLDMRHNTGKLTLAASKPPDVWLWGRCIPSTTRELWCIGENGGKMILEQLEEYADYEAT